MRKRTNGKKRRRMRKCTRTRIFKDLVKNSGLQRILSWFNKDLDTYFNENELKETCNDTGNWKRPKIMLRCTRTPTQIKILRKVQEIIESTKVKALCGKKSRVPIDPKELKSKLLRILRYYRNFQMITEIHFRRMKRIIEHFIEMFKSECTSLIVYGENDGSDVTSCQVAKAVQALLELIEESGGDKDDKDKGDKVLFGEEGKDIYLFVRSFKYSITSGEIRLVLPHSLFPDSPDVCLFSADLQKGKRIDHEPTLEHVKNILSENGVTEISEVITLRQLKTEYDQYELKRALCNRFDLFLSDAKVSGHIVHLLGKIFYSRRKIPVPIRLDSKNLKKCVKTALHKTTLHLHKLGKIFNVKVANTLMTPKQIQENIIAATAGLHDRFPGGWDNVYLLDIRTAKTIPVPFYISTMDYNDVRVKRPKGAKNAKWVSGDLGFQRVSVHPDGRVTVKGVKKKEDDKDKLPKKSRYFLRSSVKKYNDGPPKKRRRLSQSIIEKSRKFRESKSKDVENSGGKPEDTDHSGNEDDNDGDKSSKNYNVDENISSEDESAVPQIVKNDDSEDESNPQSAKSGLFAIETAYLQKLEKTKSLKKTSRKRSNSNR